jgi:hypothetical protein
MAQVPVAEPFNSDFYVTCATVIPVLFLALAVQGRSWEAMLRTALEQGQAARRGRWHRRMRAQAASRLAQLTAFAILLAGAGGEWISLVALYRGRDGRGESATILVLTLVLVVATASGPLVTYIRVLQQLNPNPPGRWQLRLAAPSFATRPLQGGFSDECSNGPMNVRRPAWWKYPEQCRHGHPWGPGRVIVSWSPCDCAPAQAELGRGHLTVSCRSDGCRSRWYQPRHDPATTSWQPGRAGG